MAEADRMRLCTTALALHDDDGVRDKPVSPRI